MTQASKDPQYMATQLAADGFDHARQYFVNPAAAKEREHALDVLKALTISSRLRSTQAHEMAIGVKLAKLMGKEGDDLAPLWERITGRPLPAMCERASDEGGQQAA